MARLIPFYIPQSFIPAKRQWRAPEQRGRVIEFQRTAIKEVCLTNWGSNVPGVFSQSLGALTQGLHFTEEQVHGR